MANIRFSNLAWISLVVTYLVIMLLSIDAWRRGPFIGFTVEENIDGEFIADVETAGRAWEAGVRSGDALLSVDGALAGQHSETALRDPRAEVVFRSSDTGASIFASPDDGLPDKPNPIGIEIVGGVFAVLGVFAYVRSSRGRHTTVFSWLSLTFAIGFAAGAGALVWHTPTTVVVGITMHWIPVLLLATVLLFAASDPHAGGFGWRRWLVPAATLAVVLQALHLITLVIAPEFYETVLLARFGFFAIGLLLTPFLMMAIYLRANSNVVREQARIVFIGTAVGLSPFALLILVPGIFGQSPFLRPDFAALTFLVIPVAFVYAILRHELMGIRRLVHRGVAYALMSTVAITVYVVGVIAVRAWADETNDSAFAVSGVVLLAAIGGLPLVSRIRSETFGIVDRVLYRQFNDQSGLLRRVSLEAVQATDVDSLIKSMMEAVKEALDLEFAGYAEFRDGLIQSELRIGSPTNAAVELIRHFEFETASLVTESAFTEDGRERSVILCQIVFVDSSQARSLLYFGPKVSDEPFLDADQQMIEVLCDVVSTAGSRLRLLDQLRSLNAELVDTHVRLVETEERERAAVSAYLHDEPLQKVTYVMSQYKERGLSNDLLDVLNEVAGELRATSLKLSPAFITDLGLVPTLEWLADETRARSEFDVELIVEQFDRKDRLESAAELTIYRVVQESLTNCEKHSAATEVRVSLTRPNGSVTAIVEDNGLGLPFLKPDFIASEKTVKSLGIRTMKYRVEAHGGTFKIEDVATGGTRVVVSIPT